MKKNIFIMLSLLLAVAAGAQQKQGMPSRPIFSSPTIKKQVRVGTSKLRVLYAFQPKDIKDEDTWIDCGQLLTDGGMTQYSSKFIADNYKALVKWQDEHPKADYFPHAIGLRGRMTDYWSEYQYGQVFTKGGELTEWAIMPMAEWQQYRYKEAYPSMKWKLEKETKVICGYTCQKAVTHWRGRDFVAWFTQDIPLKSGPWKFGGLPGLIMKVHDTKFFYKWEAVAVEHGSFPMMQYDEKMFKDTTRKKVWQMQYDYNYKYGELSGQIEIKTGRPNTKRHPYEQLEKE